MDRKAWYGPVGLAEVLRFLPQNMVFKRGFLIFYAGEVMYFSANP